MEIVVQTWFNGGGSKPRLGLGLGGQDAIMGNSMSE
jgi:hypothetical protein